MAAQAGIPSPAFSSSLAYYDGLRADRLPAALVQGQRDFFGAHTYQRVDKDGTFHTLWSGNRAEIQAADSH
jgi:6-phosphogluconate dehydrogenase